MNIDYTTPIIWEAAVSVTEAPPLFVYPSDDEDEGSHRVKVQAWDCRGHSRSLAMTMRNDGTAVTRIKIPAASKLSFVREIKEKEWQAINNCGKLENFLKKLKKVEKSVSKQLD